jgi:dipeptidyl aminopeptidase/acylaminoacyl peptidase
MKHVTLALTVLTLCWGPLSRVAVAQERPASATAEQLLDSLFAVREFKQVALSPDGRFAAWVEAIPPQPNASVRHSAIYLADLGKPEAKPMRLTAGDGQADHDEHGVAWSHDGGWLAFLSDKEQPGQLQLYVARPAGDEMRRVTKAAGFLADPQWSPDGKRLAVLQTAGARQAIGATQPSAREIGVVEEHVAEQRLAVVELDSGEMRLISPADHHVYEYDWSPDGERMAAIAAPGSGDNNWYIAKLYVLDVAAGRMTPLADPHMQIAMPRWSPDGRTIAFIGGLMSDEGLNGGDIFLLPAEGGQPRNVTPDWKASASWLGWSASSQQLMFAEHVDGGSGLASLDVGSGEIDSLWTGPETITATARGFGVTPGISLSQDGRRSAIIRHSFQHPPEIWTGPAGDWKRLTRANEKLRPGWGETESLHWTNDGREVQGWLMYPKDFDSERRYPLVVSVHGGPASACKPHWPRHSDFTWLSGQGYFVFCPNPRGSLGRGTAFARANVKDFGHGDLADILSGVDEIIRTLPVDGDRLGIVGWSYGGYMTMWAVTQTNRFRAAIAGAGIANWQSYYGQNEIDQWMIPFFGASVYDDPRVYAKSSPIEFVKQVQTPTLLLVGERDKECPAVQSREFWHALKTLDVPTQLVIYPGEGHSIAKPEHRRDIARRSLAWFQERLAPPKEPQ